MFYFIYYFIVYDGVAYTRFSSPDGKEEFLVIESSSSEVYQITGKPFFVEHVASLTTKFRFQPFHKGNYELEWIEPNKLKISYDLRGRNHVDDQYRDVLIEYKHKK